MKSDHRPLFSSTHLVWIWDQPPCSRGFFLFIVYKCNRVLLVDQTGKLVNKTTLATWLAIQLLTSLTAFGISKRLYYFCEMMRLMMRIFYGCDGDLLKRTKTLHHFAFFFVLVWISIKFEFYFQFMVFWNNFKIYVKKCKFGYTANKASWSDK